MNAIKYTVKLAINLNMIFGRLREEKATQQQILLMEENYMCTFMNTMENHELLKWLIIQMKVNLNKN